MTSDVRLPDFLIIGAAKSGTTSLWHWLGQQPEIGLPEMKSPQFFSHERPWSRGVNWYASMFAGVASDGLTGEASASYTNPKGAAKAAERIAKLVPDAKLIYVLRHPIDRIRSHYRHELQRGREHRPLSEVVAEEDNDYVGQSLYWTCLTPYVQRFSSAQICVVRMEDLVDGKGIGWTRVLSHLGLDDRPCPRTAHNVTADKPQYRRLLTAIHRRAPMKMARALPAPVRRAGKLLLTRENAHYRDDLETSSDPLPGDVQQRVWDDLSGLETWLGSGPLWMRGTA